MNIRRIALYALVLIVAAILAREPLINSIQDWRESRERAQHEQDAAAIARWTIAYATRAADSDDPQQRVMAARVLYGLRWTGERRREEGLAPAHTPAELATYDSRADALVRDLLAGPADELALWLLAAECPEALKACDRPLALRRLRELAGDNVSVQILALSQAKDAAARREALAAAARATRDTSYWMPGLDAALAMQDAVPMPADVRAGLDTDRDDVARMVMGFMHTLALPAPPMSALLEACKPEALPADDPAWRDDCVAAARALVEAGENLLGYSVGLRVLRRLFDGTAEEAAIVERLREREWLLSQHRVLPASDDLEFAELVPWAADWRSGGELHAFREKLRRHDLALVPPPGWVPENPEALQP